MSQDHIWLKTTEEKLQSLLADEAKNGPILDSLQQTVRQLKAKHTFRLALINQLINETKNQA